MFGRKFNAKSPRAIRGLAWQKKLLSDISFLGFDTYDVRDYYRQKGIEDQKELCLLEWKHGDLMVLGNNRKNFECIVCPVDKKGYFPEHKIENYITNDSVDKWYAFIISKNGINGETVFIPANVWNSYARKLPRSKWHGKNFREYSSKILKNIRCKKMNIEEIFK